MTKLQSQYNQAIQALKDLEITDYPSFEIVKSKLSKHQKEQINKGNGQLVICPAITPEFTFYDLIDRFDQQQSEKTYIYKELWDQYNLSQPMTIAVANNKLLGTNKNLKEQSKQKITFLTPVEWLMLNAINGASYLDTRSYCSFPQYPMKTTASGAYGPSAGVFGGQASLIGWYGVGDPDRGFRSAVGQRIKLEPQTSNLSSISFPDLLEERERIVHDLMSKIAEAIEEFNNAFDRVIEGLEEK